MIATVGMLVWVLAYVAGQGLKYLGPQFLTQTPPGNPSRPGGGFLNGIIGSVITTGIATVLSVPSVWPLRSTWSSTAAGWPG